MLKAMNLENNEVINLLDEEWKQQRSSLKYFSQKDKLICPQCKKNVRLHWAIPTRKVPHFKHQSNRDCIYGSGESDEHNKGKVLLFNYFKTTYASQIKHIDIEHFIPETNQIADVYIELNNGQKWVVEYQRSNISTEEIRHRKYLYETNQIKDIWVVGENLIKENGMVTKSIQSTAQELIFTDFSGEASLISFDPITEDVSIMRGLLKQNQTTYTFNYEYTYKIDDIRFNRRGQPFGVNDYMWVKQFKLVNIRFGTMRSKLYVESLTPANLQDKSYFIVKAPSYNGDLFISISPELENFIPLEMQDLVFEFDLILDPFEQEAETNPFIIHDVYPAKWADYLSDIAKNRDPLSEPAKCGFLFNLLVHTYQSHYITRDEREKEIFNLVEKGRQLPHGTANNYLKKLGVIDSFVSKDSFIEKVSLEEVLEPFLKMIKVDFENGSSIEQSLRQEIIMPNELELPLTNGCLLEIYKRVDSHLHKFSAKEI